MATLDIIVKPKLKFSLKKCGEVVPYGITPEEKAKLAGIEENANNYTHPETHPSSILDVVDVVNGAANKFLNERGEMVAVSHESLTAKNSEAAFQHVDTTTTKDTLAAADMVPIKDSVTGKMVLTPKSNFGAAVVQNTGTSETDVMSQKSVTDELAAKEVKANKQNSLAVDGTGEKFPTVDAVKTRADEIESLIIRKLVTPLGATYNTTTKLYSLNGLTDITEAQMINIYNYTAVMIRASSWNEAFNSVNFRTNIQGTNKGNSAIQALYSFQNNPALEVFKMDGGIYLTATVNMFNNCSVLREVNFIYMQMSTASQANTMFQNCPALVTCNLRNLKVNLSLQWSPLLSLASLQYMIQYRGNGTTPITITVHPTVFAKLTDNVNYPTWYAVAQDALTKYITFATV